MRVLVFSDTHRRISSCIKVIETIEKVDYIIHLGDNVQDALDIKAVFPKIPIGYVPGNNDFSFKGKKEKIITIENKKIFLTHGHMYRVKYEYQTIIERAQLLKVDILLFGHTHEAYLKRERDLYILNPGSISLPNYQKPSYGVIEIVQNNVYASIINTR